jgi:hypothetical protein
MSILATMIPPKNTTIIPRLPVKNLYLPSVVTLAPIPSMLNGLVTSMMNTALDHGLRRQVLPVTLPPFPNAELILVGNLKRRLNLLEEIYLVVNLHGTIK